MRVLELLVAAIDGLNEWIGRIVAWLTLGTVLVCFGVVLLRYGFDSGYIWLQDLYVWQHAIVFMLGAGYTFLHNGHVRVDIFYGKAPLRRRAWIDIFGTVVFLFSWLIVLAYESASFILGSWAIREASPQAGGLQGAYLLKTCIWAFCLLVGLQGLSLVAKRILFLAEGDDRYAPVGGH